MAVSRFEKEACKGLRTDQNKLTSKAVGTKNCGC